MSNLGSESFSAQTSVWPLVILRVGLGYLFFKVACPKFNSLLGTDKLSNQLTGWINETPSQWYPWYRNYISHYFIPHSDLLTYLVVFGEVAVALCLIIGFMTRPALLAAVFMNLNYQLASGYRPGAASIINLIFIFAELALLFTTVGRAFGVDYFLNKRYPRSPLW